MTERKQQVSRPHWYYISHFECPVCGKYGQMRERRFEERPVDAAERNGYFEMYDWCIESAGWRR